MTVSQDIKDCFLLFFRNNDFIFALRKKTGNSIPNN